MTDDDRTPARDLTAELEAWAAATDPTADPTTADEVRDPDRAYGALPRGGRPWRSVAAVAATVAVLAGGLAFMLGRQAGPSDDALAATASGDGPRLQVVVVTEPSTEQGRARAAVETFALVPGCPDTPRCPPPPPLVSGPLEPGVMLAVDTAVAPGTYSFEHRVQFCPEEGCGPPTPSGLLDGVDTAVTCGARVTVGDSPLRVLVRVSGDGTVCTTDDGPVPRLTVPAAWSVRPALPWSCGAAAWDINGQVGSRDPQGAMATLGCLRDALATGAPVETPVAELQPGDGLTRSWWRSRPGPDPDRPLEVIRDQGLDGVAGWAVVRCESIGVEASDVDTTTPDGGITGYQYVAARPSGCGAEEPLSLDLPDLEGPAPTTTTTGPTTTPPAPTTATLPPATAGEPPAPGTVDVVLDGTDLPGADEPTTWTWTVHLGEPDPVDAARSGTVQSWLDPPVALVADDLSLPDDTPWVGLMVDDGAGTANLCLGGLPPSEARRVLVVHIGESTCTPEWTDTVPHLTVPPEWSLREPATRCVDLDPAARWNQCLVDADLDATGVAEWAQPGPTTATTYRVERGTITVVERTGGLGRPTWTVTTCAGFDISEDHDQGRGIAMTDCGTGPREMSLTP